MEKLKGKRKETRWDKNRIKQTNKQANKQSNNQKQQEQYDLKASYCADNVDRYHSIIWFDAFMTNWVLKLHSY